MSIYRYRCVPLIWLLEMLQSPLVSGLTLSLLLAACQSPQLTEKSSRDPGDLRRHVVLANSAGSGVDPDRCDLRRGVDVDSRSSAKPDEVVAGLRSFVDKQVRSAREGNGTTQVLRLLVFVHGGLNEAFESCDRALDHTSFLQRNEPNTYPVFLIWPSGGAGSYGDEITSYSEGFRHNNPLESAGAPSRIVLDPLGGLTRAPGAAVHQTVRLFRDIRYNLGGADKDPELAPEERPDRYDSRSVTSWQQVTAENNVIYDEGRRKPDWPSKARSYTLVPLLFPVRVGLTPFVDGYGSTTWRNLKRRAYGTVRIEADRDAREDQHPSGSAEEVSPCSIGSAERHEALPDGAFGVFAVELVKLLNEDIPDLPDAVNAPDGQRRRLRYGDLLRVDLVGHSMGGIVINEILHELPCLEVANLVYLGSAASLNQFDKTGLAYLSSTTGAQTKAYFVSLHPINESNEDLSDYFPLLPRGSLLYWIDTMYEPTSRGLEKTMGSWTNIMAYKALIPDEIERSRIVFKVFSFDPDLPQRHGDLNDVICSGHEARCDDPKKIRYAYWSPESWSAGPLAGDRAACLNVRTGEQDIAGDCVQSVPVPLGNTAITSAQGAEQPTAAP